MSDIRKCFKSRFGKQGRILELDFSQLEIYVLAFLSGDPQLKADLLSGADLHGISAENLFGTGYTDKQRKIAKTLSFQLQYGSGYKNMAASNQIPEATAKQFIENYYNRYPKVKEFQDANIKYVEQHRQQSNNRTKSGYPAGVSNLPSGTGRYYAFVEQDAPDFMKERGQMVSFSPTQIKNYPVQGFATADIVPMVLGKLYRYLKGSRYDEYIKMIGTIHDSVVFDCVDEEYAWEFSVAAKAIMEEAPKYLKDIFNIDFDLPLIAEASVGVDWHDMVGIDI